MDMAARIQTKQQNRLFPVHLLVVLPGKAAAQRGAAKLGTLSNQAGHLLKGQGLAAQREATYFFGAAMFVRALQSIACREGIPSAFGDLVPVVHTG